MRYPPDLEVVLQRNVAIQFRQIRMLNRVGPCVPVARLSSQSQRDDPLNEVFRRI